MVIIASNLNIAYFPVPKNACTSLKLLFYELCHGVPFTPQPALGIEHVHHVYGSPAFPVADRAAMRDMRRIAVIRDPIERFLSAYGNRVLYLRELSAGAFDMDFARRLGLPCDPPLDVFIDHLDAYRLTSWSIRHHTEPQTFFLGWDLSYFTDVYTIRDLLRLADDLADLLGRPVVVPREQTSGPKVGLEALDEARLTRLIEFYAGDYALLRDYFSPDTVFKKWKQAKARALTQASEGSNDPPGGNRQVALRSALRRLTRRVSRA